MSEKQAKETEVTIPGDRMFEIDYLYHFGGEPYNLRISVSTNPDKDGLFEIYGTTCSNGSAVTHFMAENQSLFSRIRLDNYLKEKIKEKIASV